MYYIFKTKTSVGRTNLMAMCEKVYNDGNKITGKHLNWGHYFMFLMVIAHVIVVIRVVVVYHVYYMHKYMYVNIIYNVYICMYVIALRSFLITVARTHLCNYRTP